MASSINYDNEYIVGGSANSRLTPNFKLKEFLKPNGKIFVHRELVVGLQLLRDNFGASISIDQITPSAAFNPFRSVSTDKDRAAAITAVTC